MCWAWALVRRHTSVSNITTVPVDEEPLLNAPEVFLIGGAGAFFN